MTFNFNMRRALLSATALAAGYLAGPALAATSATDDAVSLMDELVVTATRRATTIQDAPMNITAVGGSALEEARIDDVRDLVDMVPGVTLLDTGPRSVGNVIIRGLSANSTGSSGSDTNNAVATYLGEVPLYLDFKLIDIERVEALLGPQGTLYGAGTLAGAMRYIPKRPDTTQFGMNLHLRGYDIAHGSGYGWNADAVINIPLLEDKLALRSVLATYNDPGFIDYPYIVRFPGLSNPEPDLSNPDDVNANLRKGKDLNDERTISTRNTLLWKVNDDIDAIFTHVYQQTRTNGRQANGAGVLGTGKYEAPWRFEEPTRRKAHLLSAEFNINLFDFAQFVSASAWSKQKNRSKSDVTDMLLDFEYGYELFPSFAGYTTSRNDYKQFNQEMRLVSTHDGPLSWVLGVFYNEFERDNDSFEITPGLPEFLGKYRPDNIEYASYIQSKTKEQAVFGEATFEITNAWQVTAGGRYFKYKADITGGTRTPMLSDPYPEINFRSRSGSTKDDGFIYKLNTSYKFSDELMTYVTVSKGYRIGGVNRVAPCVLPLPPGQNVCALPNELFYGPDKTLNKELGIRANLYNGRLTANLAVFHIDWSDVQVSSRTLNGNVGITANAAKAVSKGVEFSFQARPTRELTFSGNYSYNDAHLTQDVPILVDGKYDAFSGDRLASSPKHSGSINASYTTPLNDETDVRFSYGVNYMGNVYSKTGLRGYGEKIPGYTTHKTSLTFQQERWEVSLFADNLFDKYAVIAVGQDTDVIGTSGLFTKRYYSHVVLKPRVVGLEARIRY